MRVFFAYFNKIFIFFRRTKIVFTSNFTTLIFSFYEVEHLKSDDSFLQTGQPICPGFLVGPDKGGRAGDVGHAQDEELPVEAEVGRIEVGARSGNRLDKL